MDGLFTSAALTAANVQEYRNAYASRHNCQLLAPRHRLGADRWNGPPVCGGPSLLQLLAPCSRQRCRAAPSRTGFPHHLWRLPPGCLRPRVRAVKMAARAVAISSALSLAAAARQRDSLTSI